MKLFLSFLLFVISLNIFCQDIRESLKINELEEVVVSSTRTERKVSSLPLPTQIISGELIRQSGVSRLNEIIQEQTGLIMVSDFGGGEGIQMQGLDSAYTMILVDGQPLIGRVAGTLDLSRITVNNIEKIEIVKGASSSLYGSEAIAGVVNIITKKSNFNNNELTGNLNYRTASFNTLDFTSFLEYAFKKVNFQLFQNYFSSDGYNLSNNNFLNTVEPYKNLTIQPKVQINFSNSLSLNFNTRFYNQNQINKSIINNNKYDGESKINEWNNTVLLKHTISNKFKAEYDFYFTNYKANEFLNDENNLLFDESKFNQCFYRPEIRTFYKLGKKNILTTGIGLNKETLDKNLFKEEAVLNSEYIFSQIELFIGKKLNIISGFRFDHHNQYQSQFSPKLAVNYQLNNNFSVKSSFGYGYKAPDLRQLFLDFTNSSVGYSVFGYNVASENLALLQSQNLILFSNNLGFSNPLKPESSINFNFGGYFKKNKFLLDYNLFYNQIDNLIDTRAIAQKVSGQNVFSYFNVDKIFTYGIELNSTYKISQDFTISAGYQYLIAKDNTISKKN